MPPRSSPIPASPAAGVRGTIDAIVQGALVELFHAYGVALAPSPRSAPPATLPIHEVTAAISFVRESQGGRSERTGRLLLSMPRDVFVLLSAAAGGGAPRDDWARELTNQLIGRIKNRLLQFGATLQIGLPVASDADTEGKRERSATLRVYTGRTVRGNVLLALEGMPEEAELSYVGPEGLAAEGEVILF
jgi:hypothetical protein